MARHKYGKMPNEGKGYKTGHMGGKGSGSNTGASTGLKKSSEMRADVTKQPSNKNPYPRGLA